MYTQCPECMSVFSLSAHTLGRARGYLLCGHCGAQFDGLATLTDKLPVEPFGQLAILAEPDAPVTVDLVVYRPKPEPPPPLPETDLPVPGVATQLQDFSKLEFAPRFAHGSMRRKPRSHRHLRRPSPHRALWTAACGILLLVLAGQVAWAEREALITQPSIGNWLRESCAVLRCSLPLVAAPARLRVVDSNVQSHPSVAHALLISARISNDAAFAQPYPVVTVTLSDAQGKRLAMRRLSPREYLDDPQTLRHGLGPGASSVLMLEVADPGDQAVEFELGFE
ncbi:MAG: zinc-ribbon and DUF3426 domain-containing protein [Rhodanobacter sp.]